MKIFISGLLAVSLVFLTSCASICCPAGAGCDSDAKANCEAKASCETEGDSCCSSDGEACCSEEKAAQCCVDAAKLGKDCEKCK